MWDDDFTSKKFELGRIIERDATHELIKGIGKLDLQQQQKENQDRGRVIKTKNIDFFLNCDLMGKEQIEEELKQNKLDEEEEDDEDEPEWNDVDVEMLKIEAKPEHL